VGGPQPALVELFGAFPPAGPVLDVGCGSGDLAIHLAQTGLEVLGIDFSERAIEQARARAAALPADAARSLDFAVADALRPSLLQRQFGAVVDSGFLHVLEPGDRDRFATELASVVRPGGRYYLLGFRERRRWFFSRRGISDVWVWGRFGQQEGWRIRDAGPAEFLTVKGPVPAIAACIERLLATRA
jgi:SAM-dependent methyltransferase